MEEWKWIKDYEGVYQISSYGKVKSFIGKEKLLKPQITRLGYGQVFLKPKWRLVHRLVAEHFIPNPDNLPIVNHKDSVPSNCDISNLEWVTQSQNMKHKHDLHWKKICEKYNMT